MSERVINIFNQMIGPLKRRVLLMIGRGILTAVDVTKDIQQCNLNLLADETKDRTELFQNYGFTSFPPPGTEVIMLSVGADRGHGVIVASENRNLRFKGLSEGDSALYNKNGKYVWLNGNDLKILIEKIEINNSSHELIAVLVEYFEKSRDALNITIAGPMPKTTVSKLELTVIIDKLKTFKV